MDILRGRLRARLGTRRPIFIGSPPDSCSSPTNCGEGVATLQFARDRYVITDGATVYDLARGGTRRCEDVPEICATR